MCICELLLCKNVLFFSLHSFSIILETQSVSQRGEHKGAGPSWVSPEPEQWGGSAGDQSTRPRALSQSAVHSPDRRDGEKELIKVWSEMYFITF